MVDRNEEQMRELSARIESATDEHVRNRLRILSADADAKTNMVVPQPDMLFCLRKRMAYSYEAYRRV